MLWYQRNQHNSTHYFIQQFKKKKIIKHTTCRENVDSTPIVCYTICREFSELGLNRPGNRESTQCFWGVGGLHWQHLAKSPNVSTCLTKLVMLAHPPNPKPTTKTQPTTKMLMAYMAVQLGMKEGGFSAAFCNSSQ